MSGTIFRFLQPVLSPGERSALEGSWIGFESFAHRAEVTIFDIGTGGSQQRTQREHERRPPARVAEDM